MSGLDEKLKAIVLAGPNGEHGHLSTEEIAQIRQAFEDEGYVQMAYNPVKREIQGKSVDDVLATDDWPATQQKHIDNTEQS